MEQNNKMIVEVKHNGTGHLVSLELDCLPFEMAKTRQDISNILDEIFSKQQALSKYGYIKTFGNQTPYLSINALLKGFLRLSDEDIERLLKDSTLIALNEIEAIGKNALNNYPAQEKLSEK